MSDKDEEWIPLREAVSEVATAYAKYMHCEPREAVPDAWTAILRRLETGGVSSRAHFWTLEITDSDGKTVQFETSKMMRDEILCPLWFLFRKNPDEDTKVESDWVCGDFEFYQTIKSDEGQSFAFACAFGVVVDRSSLPVIGDDASKRATIAGNRKRLPTTALQAWWDGLDENTRALPQDTLWMICKAHFPSNSVARDRIRALDPGRKPGPKPISEE